MEKGCFTYSASVSERKDAGKGVGVGCTSWSTSTCRLPLKQISVWSQMWCLQNKLAHFLALYYSAYSCLLPCKLGKPQNNKMFSCFSSLVDSSTSYTTSLCNIKTLVGMSKRLKSKALFYGSKLCFDLSKVTVNQSWLGSLAISLSSSICLRNYCSCTDPSVVLWVNVLGELHWRTDFNLTILIWFFGGWVFFFVSIPVPCSDFTTCMSPAKSVISWCLFCRVQLFVPTYQRTMGCLLCVCYRYNCLCRCLNWGTEPG